MLFSTWNHSSIELELGEKNQIYLINYRNENYDFGFEMNTQINGINSFNKSANLRLKKQKCLSIAALYRNVTEIARNITALINEAGLSSLSHNDLYY